MLAPLLGIAGLAGVGIAAGIRARNRQPLPSDLAAQVKAGLMAPDAKVLLAVITALSTSLGGKWKPQVQIVWRATQATHGKSPPPADVGALYDGALKSGSPNTLIAVANQFAKGGKYPHLVSNLRDVAKILVNVPGA